ncbi:hypothetical protein [Muriicola marianensis]|uniref:Uncharacterized protein n=1 Tax=Muriicola marianensis TaxID=1324801 RepID=A0ABQ1QZ33_9FLAO|nr:hypothetical protein [Muriicola marianensis]GGD50831.1 hypothetical protein GCM10011361_16840 [Muriicola marianensis]
MLIGLWAIGLVLSAQEASKDYPGQELPELFRSESPLQLRLRYSNKSLKQDTNDSTYLESMIWSSRGGGWDSLPVSLRARGNFRRKTCYFAPLKLKFRKSKTRSTLFEGSEKLKMVLPCQLDRNTGDYVLKEYLAYKLYETVAPYHFKTRLAEVSLFEERGRREVTHEFFGFLIEDMDFLCERYGGQELKRLVHPLQHDDEASVFNAFFEFMIANTDYSTKQQHNQKLLFTEKRIIPVPYDFDMSGLVNAPYAAVTNIQNLSGSITQVTDRIYKGYERDTEILEGVRRVFLNKRSELLAELDEIEPYFQDMRQFREAQKFLQAFFEILEDDKKFERQILDRLRTR